MVEASELTRQFALTFRQGIEVEKAALRSESVAYEVPLENGAREERGAKSFYRFRVARASDRLAPGVQCSLKDATGVEVAVTITEIDGQQIVLQAEADVALVHSPYRLAFVPWFLYDGMASALDEIPWPESAQRAFGKHTCERHTLPPVQLERPLNDSQRAAVQQAAESQLTLIWGPPGTGKTSTLAELVINLVRLQRRVLIVSTTHAALDQVLERLAETKSLQDTLMVRLGYSSQGTFGCSLGEVVDRTQAKARRQLDRSLARLQTHQARLHELKPLLDRCKRAASQAEQLDFFAEQSAALNAADLSGVLSSQRARALAAQTARAQQSVLVRLWQRTQEAAEAHRQRARRSRQQLMEGQQQAVDGARVLLSTLANLYVSPLMKDQQFDSVILEEAGMALLPAVYLAAGRARQQVIMVGDPQQLPAILTSKEPLAHRRLGRSIFEVLGERPERVMLDVQYRMHPCIGELVSRLFYGGALQHAAGTEVQTIAARPPFAGQALIVVDSGGGTPCRTDPGDFSRYNQGSADRAVELAREAASAGSSVAIIAPYRKQVRKIQTMLTDRGLTTEQVQCATVHRFQGNERDVVILDTVDGPPLEPGTLLCGRGPRAASANLLNVSVSRARGKLIVIVDVAYVRARADGTILHQLVEAALQSRS